MSSLNRAKIHFNTKKLDTEGFVIGHLSDETARLYARDLFLIGYTEESEILSENDKSKYTAIVNKISGQACEVFFDIPAQAEIKAESDARGRETTQIPY
ncbi:MAG TPA: hypothetical protein ENN67_07660 [Firmicutes bacterium]|nr:hypothetical protein [Bacillota bacterium]